MISCEPFVDWQRRDGGEQPEFAARLVRHATGESIVFDLSKST